MAKEKLIQDYDRLKNDETEKEKRLKDLSAISDKKEQAKQDMKGRFFVSIIMFFRSGRNCKQRITIFAQP